MDERVNEIGRLVQNAVIDYGLVSAELLADRAVFRLNDAYAYEIMLAAIEQSVISNQVWAQLVIQGIKRNA